MRLCTTPLRHNFLPRPAPRRPATRRAGGLLLQSASLQLLHQHRRELQPCASLFAQVQEHLAGEGAASSFPCIWAAFGVLYRQALLTARCG